MKIELQTVTSYFLEIEVAKKDFTYLDLVIRQRPIKGWLAFTLALIILGHAISPVAAQEWSYYGANKGGTKYSALDQITSANVEELEVAWVYRTGEVERRGDKINQSAFENTPILVDDSLIVCTQFSRIISLDPATGEERWVFDPDISLASQSGSAFKCKGVSWWLDKTAEESQICRKRILLTTPDMRLIAIDAQNGRRCSGFGMDGEVTVTPETTSVVPGEQGLSSPPSVVGGVVVVGSTIYDNLRADAPSGVIRAFDARTGAARWSFDPVPRNPEDPMYATWGVTTKDTGGTNVWSIMSVDEESDLVFLPTTSPSNDFYGGQRPGQNRYANSVVALKGSTGEIVWHYQITHHDLWDTDLPAQPILVDLERDGKAVPALIQITKQGFVFVFNRETGESLFPIEERPVPQDGVEGEWVSPTQPFPVKPPPFVKQGIAVEDAWGFTFFDRMMCRRKLEARKVGGIYTPPSLKGTVMMPGWLGGGNWGGGAYDPRTGLLFVNSSRVPMVVRLVPIGLDGKPGPDVTLEDVPEEERHAKLDGVPYELRGGIPVVSIWSTLHETTLGWSHRNRLDYRYHQVGCAIGLH